VSQRGPVDRSEDDRAQDELDAERAAEDAFDFTDEDYALELADRACDLAVDDEVCS
jgi:hypothetical protein